MRTFPGSARQRTLVLASALAVACAFAAQPGAWAKTPQPKPTHNKKLDHQIAAAADGVDAAAIKVKQARDAYTRVKAKADKAAAEYQRVVARSNLAHQRALAVRARYWNAVAVSRASAAGLAHAQGVLQMTAKQYQEMVRNVYMGGSSLLQLSVVLDTMEPSDLALRLQGYNALGEAHNTKLHNLTNARDTKAARLALAKANQRAVEKLSKQLTTADHQAAAAKIATHHALYVSKTAAAAAARSLNGARNALSNAMAQLAALKQAQRGIDVSSRTHSTGIRPGSLAWPVIGHTRISSTAGPRPDPIMHTPGCHPGIDIPAGTGTPIHAAASGIVVTAGRVRGYGNMTLIAHGGGMATLYGHQSKILVRVGEHVVKDEIIGKVGSTGWSTGPHLHFEVRLAGQPYNPLGWFGQGRTKVSCYHRH
jgi:murein DD-endopeptidase MepM/ murein hydrolase activator NlpD